MVPLRPQNASVTALKVCFEGRTKSFQASVMKPNLNVSQLPPETWSVFSVFFSLISSTETFLVVPPAALYFPGPVLSVAVCTSLSRTYHFVCLGSSEALA